MKPEKKTFSGDKSKGNLGCRSCFDIGQQTHHCLYPLTGVPVVISFPSEKEGQNLRLIFSGILPDRALEEYSHAELVLRLRGKRRASAANRSLSLFVRMSGTGWEKIIGKQRRLGDIRGFWVAFDLSKNLLKWRSEMRSVPSQSQSQSGSLALSVAIPFDENALRDLTHFSGSFEPILVLYTHDPEEILATSVALQMDPSRARRSVPVPNGVVAGSGASDCSLKPWSVSFDQLGWGALVITPTSLEANSCEGTCETSHMNNHAFLKTVYLSRHSRHTDLSGACCVPAKLRPISILFSTNGTIYLKQMPDMIAEECHCL